MTISRPELSVLARIRSSASLLGPSEAKVAALIVERADEVVEWSTAELAQAAGTSTATVIRACQSLGFRGFQHLRLELARSAPMKARDGDDVASGAFDDAVEAVRLAQESVSPASVAAAVELLRGARRVVLVSNGFSGPPLQDFAMRLSTLGRAVEAPIDPLAQQFAVASLGEDDLCFALSYSGANVQTLRAAAAARDRGTPVAAVTSFARSPLGRIAGVVVATGPAAAAHDVDPFLARIGHTVVLHALHSGLADGTTPTDAAGMRHVVADAIAEEE
ncbi:MurR/RpiR family transcriptional regulator [Microbacterium imperiale]|uniref:RpiR family transcriptional regulator n=1 Tax=Microbacterium imperiale TaxID=33884 RepID=A0A9W6M3Z3_9MICO|nr:MurR/RpiR family transcriptional regulator [Microbacterium imperiale]MBP2421230.1 DNA-binding MurR/RpiR family transcriptional regulator [Microbacterium imperiale]MDS0199659.1 MurR/RpiR family transcriptional regulator [Microbacterium imperiale]BFE41570.1 MurR/RpiR family transcriptional regulator [Microbacterium imperiale]GLJ80521.1 RpiR family transcriptional regulator [Microbacterium imperiale]